MVRLPKAITEFAETIGPAPDETLEEMRRHAEETGFPIVGPTVGGWLALLARTVGARRVFEFGSGFGYSAYWFASALPPEGKVVLTEIDDEELNLARRFFREGGLADRAAFEHGDAIEIVREYDGPFDVVLVDCAKERYGEAFDAVRQKVPAGGMVLADNAMRADPVVDFENLRRIVSGGDPAGASEETKGVADYLARVRADPEFRTCLLPLGSGVAVSYRIE